MEIVITVFIGAWLSGFAWFAYRQLKKEYGGKENEK